MKAPALLATSACLLFGIVTPVDSCEQEGTGKAAIDTAAVRNLRLTQFFIIGEKSSEPPTILSPSKGVMLAENQVVDGVHYLRPIAK